MSRVSSFANELIKAGYCRVSKTKQLAARIDKENWVEILAEHHSKTFQGMLLAVLTCPEKYEDIYRREFSKDVIMVGKTTSVALPGSISTSTGYIVKQQHQNSNNFTPPHRPT